MPTSIVEYTLKNENNDSISIINYGARITSWNTQVSNKSRNIVLGYSNLNDYLIDPFYLGAVAGPYANRIKRASYKLDSQTVTLDKNEGDNQLHGGNNALSNLFWQLDYCKTDALSLSIYLSDGYNGYPGNTRFTVIYKLTAKAPNESSLEISFFINSDTNTIAGPTSHPYFNLAGIDKSSIGHSLKVLAEHYTPVDDQAIPTGEIRPTKNTPFDFSKTKMLDNNVDKLDHNFVCATKLDLSKLKQQALLMSPDNKLSLDVFSNYPAIQIYSGQHLNQPFSKFDGICLEPQFCPDSPNQSNFPFKYLTANETLQTSIVYLVKK